MTRPNFLLLLACTCLLTAGVSVVVSGQDAPNRPRARREVAVTFDDLPGTHASPEALQYVTARLLKGIKANHVPAIGFVNEAKLFVDGKPDARRTALLRMWLDAGLELGNHTFSHVQIDHVPFAGYKENVIRGEVVTRQLLAERGKTLRYFRHTQLRTGPTLEYKRALEQLLAERGYTIAPVTIDSNEFIFADIYTRAKRRGDTATVKRVVDAYLPYMEQMFAFFERLSRDSLGYEARQTLLLHANELNADHFADLARMMRGRGYRFITLEAALKDKAYSLPDAQTTRGLSWLHRWMLAKGQDMRPEPGEPEFITELFKAYPR